MAVAAARRALRGVGPVESLWLATTRPAYLEKSNAATVAVAAGLPPEAAAYDVSGALRRGAGALRAGLAAGSALVVASDIRFGLPGSADETGRTHAAAAYTDRPDPIAAPVGLSSLPSALPQPWPDPGDPPHPPWH